MPYDDVADLFIIDPDGFIIRKWNSKQLNNGLMTAEFQVKTKLVKLKLMVLTRYRSRIILKSGFGPFECQHRGRYRRNR